MEQKDIISKQVKLDKKNRIVLPGWAVKKLNLTPGDLVSVEIYNDNITLFKAYIGVRRNGNGGD